MPHQLVGSILAPLDVLFLTTVLFHDSSGSRSRQVALNLRSRVDVDATSDRTYRSKRSPRSTAACHIMESIHLRITIAASLATEPDRTELRSRTKDDDARAMSPPASQDAQSRLARVPRLTNPCSASSRLARSRIGSTCTNPTTRDQHPRCQGRSD